MSVNVSKVFNGSAWAEIRDPLVYNGSAWVRADSISSKAAEWTTGPLTGPGAPSWSPASLTGIYSWYDAQNAGSITKDGSNLVSQWNDLIATGANLTQPDATKPVYTASSFGAQPGIKFDASKHLWQTTDNGKSFLKNQNKVSIIVVMKFVTSLTNAGKIYRWSDGVSSSWDRLILSDYGADGRFLLGIRQVDQSSRYDDNSSSSYKMTLNTPFIHRLSLDLASQLPKQYTNTFGDTQDIQNAASLSSGVNFSDTYSQSGVVGEGCEFVLGEMILVRGILSSGEVTSVNSYLKSKWGLS